MIEAISDPRFMLNFITVIAALGVFWGAIRADVKNIHEKVQDAKETGIRAHDRIDAIHAFLSNHKE
jgi:outer membrane murein-binding lipoprotein Lpp